MSDLQELQKFQIEALQKENQRLNDELKQVKEMAFRIKLSDPVFDRPISEIDVQYEIVNGQ